MESIREEFGLEQYSEEAVDKVVGLKTSCETSGLSLQEIAEIANVPVEAVDDILSNTFQIWGH